MTSGDFEAKNHARWQEYEALVTALEKGKKPEDAGELPRRFRELCLDLSLAENRMYGSRITERLNGLVIRGYELVYQKRRGGMEKVVAFVTTEFPRTIRREWKLFVICSLVFWVPFFVTMLSAAYDMRWVQAILGAEGMASMEEMYGGKDMQIAHLRQEYGSNFMMFCFYIYNNVGIDFRVFASGMLAGVGTLFYLIFNGLHIGAAAGYVNHACNPESFWTFVSGHSSFELLGVVVSGMAGMKIGNAIVKPGRLTRVSALVAAAKEALPLIYGAAILTSLAAVVEGFWSAEPLPSMVKYSFGIVWWILLAAYLLFAGRRKHAAR
ncbi:MAG: stage II sporulation protein M [Luteolibacter sp.]